MAGIEAPFTANANHACSPPQNLNKHSLARFLDTRCHHSLDLLKQTHAMLIKQFHFQDNYIAGSLIKHYSNPNFNTFTTSFKVFDQVPQPHIFLWNSLIRACIDNKDPYKAILAYRRMVVQGSIPNKYTFPLVLNACTAAEAFEEGKQFHGHLVKHGLGGDRYVLSAAIQMYAACGMVAEAKGLLTDGADKACWNAMINGYMKNGEVDAAKELFDIMPDRNIRSWNAMIAGYARNGMVHASKDLFDNMPQRDEVSWSAIITGYVQCGCFTDALEMFRRMLKEGMVLDEFILSSVLTACANVGASEQGRWIHTYVERHFNQLDPVLGTSLVDMYAKCGHLDFALEVFNKMKDKQVFTWNAMIGGLAMHGHGRQALNLFSQMQQQENFNPNAITFIAVLNACAHTGLVEEGYKHINSMEKDFGIKPTMEHYGCMVDLLGRAGLFKEAERMINSMPMKPNAAVWGALLGACRIHGNVELGERVANFVLELEPENSGRYALISNIYAKAQKWDDVLKLRKLMKNRGIKTIPGISLIECEGVVHEFIAGDHRHPRAKEIYLKLNEMLNRLKSEQGYAPNTREVMFEIEEEEEKENSVSHHSEKLAIAFGLISSSPEKTIRIMKNLRICEDCHVAIKLISRLYGREIVVRDRARYHHFKDGNCSCMDYW
ncbi:hypothetical protein J5N97_001343 [Dioscorea zingiberensis]|uniref:DYW domain-containing protein n=1 Tax=Dioscorea zingiberensis TaxID=325984 RepID=A0A9D5H2I3_9LILI|nr:hypothetical protein J5N97_001343 [Dioscorea zingiberensis]